MQAGIADLWCCFFCSKGAQVRSLLYTFCILTEISESSPAVQKLALKSKIKLCILRCIYIYVYIYAALLFHSWMNLAIHFVLLRRYLYCFSIVLPFLREKHAFIQRSRKMPYSRLLMTQCECMTVLSNTSYLCQNISPAIADWRGFEGPCVGCLILILSVGLQFYGLWGFVSLGFFIFNLV